MCSRILRTRKDHLGKSHLHHPIFVLPSGFGRSSGSNCKPFTIGVGTSDRILRAKAFENFDKSSLGRLDFAAEPEITMHKNFLTKPRPFILNQLLRSALRSVRSVGLVPEASLIISRSST